MVLFLVIFQTTCQLYSGCQKYESSPIFVTKLEVRLYPEFLNTQTCTFGLQIFFFNFFFNLITLQSTHKRMIEGTDNRTGRVPN